MSIREQIANAIVTDIAPYVQSHGGVIEFCSFNDGIVSVRLSGSCHGCSAVNITLKAAVERRLRLAFEEVDRVVLEKG